MMLRNVLQKSKLLYLLLHVVHHRNETLWSILWRLVVYQFFLSQALMLV